MATMQSFRLISPTPAAFGASASARPPRSTSSATFVPAGRRQRCFPAGVTLGQAGRTAALLRPRVVVRAAHNRGGVHQPPAPDRRYFVEEMEHVMDRYNDIIHIDNGCLYMEATAVSGRVCLSANQALMMASLLQDSSAAGLTMNLGGAPPPNEISPDTIHATLCAYVKIFVDAADASYSRTVTKKTITSFLGALRGLSSISHILLHTALEALSNTHPTTGMSEYALNCDVKAMRHEFNQKMDDLENGIDKASSGIEICKLAMPVIMESTKTTGSFVALMVARRKRALARAHAEAALVV